MKLSLSISNHSDSFSNLQLQFGNSPKNTLKDMLLQESSKDMSNKDFPLSDLESKNSMFYFNSKNQEKKCLKKNEKIDLELKPFPEEKIDDESMLAFRGNLNLNSEEVKLESIIKKDVKISNICPSKNGDENLVFEQLKELDFDDEESKMKEKETIRKNQDFEMFLRKTKTSESNSSKQQSTRFNFESMNNNNLKNQTFNSPSQNSHLSQNFCYYIFNQFNGNQKIDQKSLVKSINFQNHVNLKQMSKRTPQRNNVNGNFLKMRNSGTTERVSILQKDGKCSLNSTGLRRKDVIFRRLENSNESQLKPITFLNLTSLFNQTPELARRKEKLFGYINQSLRTISMNNIYSPCPKKYQQFSQTGIRKRNKISLFNDDLFQSPTSPLLNKRNFELFENSSQQKLKNLKSKKNKNAKSEKNKQKFLQKNKQKFLQKKKTLKASTGIQKIISNIKRKKSSSKNKKCGCRCKKTKCTRLHCICFREKGYCGDGCSCTDCYNREEFADTIKKIRDFTKEINPLAFQSKIQTIDLDNGQKIHNRGCSCSKNQCQKNYCECFKNGLSCSPLCKCENCKNEKVDIDVSKVKKIFKKCSRKKKKFVIFLNEKKPTIKKIQI
jgi:hypothetical protein